MRSSAVIIQRCLGRGGGAEVQLRPVWKGALLPESLFRTARLAHLWIPASGCIHANICSLENLGACHSWETPDQESKAAVTTGQYVNQFWKGVFQRARRIPSLNETTCTWLLLVCIRQIASPRILFLVRAFNLQGDKIVTNFSETPLLYIRNALRFLAAQWREESYFSWGFSTITSH